MPLQRGQVLKRIDWKARQLVGPDSIPALTTVEDNIQTAINAHVHGKLINVEGDNISIYEAPPLNPRLISIQDSVNPSNNTLAEHVADSVIHNIGQYNPPQYKVFTGDINLLQPLADTPNHTLGSISDSWYKANQDMKYVKPVQLAALESSSSLQLNNFWPLMFPGCQQQFTAPTSFKNNSPQFGRVYQDSYYRLDESGISKDSPLPTTIAFDYLFFPFRTWFWLYKKDGNYTKFVQTVVKRHRTTPFPNGYRCPNPSQVEVISQLRQKLAHSFSIQDFAEIYYPKVDYIDEHGNVDQGEFTVPNPYQYATDPGNPHREYIDLASYKRYPVVTPDFSTFSTAFTWYGYYYGQTYDAWKDTYQRLNYWREEYYRDWNMAAKAMDWFYPLNDLDNWSFRLLWEMNNDNQVDLYPLSMCGFMIILPYCYLPLYVTKGTNQPIPTRELAEDIGMFWARTPLSFAPAGSVIKWQQYDSWEGRQTTYKAPILQSLGATPHTYGYPYPKELNLDFMIMCPE